MVKGIRAHLGRKGSRMRVPYLRVHQKPPSHTQENHNRHKVLEKHPRVIKYRTELNPKGKLYP